MKSLMVAGDAMDILQLAGICTPIAKSAHLSPESAHLSAPARPGKNLISEFFVFIIFQLITGGVSP